MCGIAGIIYFEKKLPENRVNPQNILKLLAHRGPDNQSYKDIGQTTLFHSRLSIIDTTESSNQPFTSEDQNDAMVFNGEIFNYKSLQHHFSDLRTNGDTEVLFRLVRTQKQNCLNLLNGFFAFAYYHQTDNYLLLARDRMGVKPLYYYQDKKIFAFGSELKPLMALVGPQEINDRQVDSYFRLNYCAGEESIFKNVFKLAPGQFIEVKNGTVTKSVWYKAPKITRTNGGLEQDFANLLEDAVKLRLHADVPVGTFLSGGLDSSIISALAKKHKPDLQTFSIGFADENYFDETNYADLVARHIHSNHHVFKLKEDDFLNHIQEFLSCIDEPFADSSAFNFYMLSKYTKQKVKVALSGDGADELFKGYHKHRALLLSRHLHLRLFSEIMSRIPLSSRQGRLPNTIRQIKKFNLLSHLSDLEKQKFLASISDEKEINNLLKQKNVSGYFDTLFRSSDSFSNFDLADSFDLQTVLGDDMLVKADRFSMYHGIEIRNPFLDFRVVELALNLEQDKKINKTNQKIILKNSFRHLLPEAIFTRPKKGFELPLQAWLRGALSSQLENQWLGEEKIREENLLQVDQINILKKKLYSKQPEDSAAQLWAVIVFENWLQNFKQYIKH
jgi:asparagine synthase (glutamine-hydrolysing)